MDKCEQELWSYSFDLVGERKGLENCPIKVDLNHGTAFFITVLNE